VYVLKCLGPPVLERDGTEVKLSRRKSLALLAYLAVTVKHESRDHLVELLWPDQPPAQGAGYLRTTLYDINTACPDRLVEADRGNVCLADDVGLDVDIWQFRRLVDGAGRGSAHAPSRRRLSEALALYRDAFLKGFSVRDAPPFEDWQREIAEEFTRSCEDALQSLVRTCVSEGDTAEALRFAQRLVVMDELDERYHRLLMGLEALAGKPVAAELAFQRCCRILKRELDAQPGEETRRLYDRLRSARGATRDDRLVRDTLREILDDDEDGGPAPVPRRAPAAVPRDRITFDEPSCVHVDALGRIFITDNCNHRIVRVDDMDGRGAVTFGSQGSGRGQFFGPAGIHVDAKGRILVADSQNHRIVRIDDMDGSGWAAFGEAGSEKGCFGAPNGISADALGRILVADTRNHRIVRLDDMDGSGWVSIGGPGPGDGPGQCNVPWAVIADPSGWIYTACKCATIIRMDDMDGSGWISFRPANLSARRHSFTGGLAVDSERLAVYLVLNMDPCVIRIDGMTGLRWSCLTGRPGCNGSSAPGANGFSNPFGIALDARRRIYVANRARGCIVRVDDMLGNGWTEFPGEGK
jgi:DNA-binding SARP family transcriptional activator